MGVWEGAVGRHRGADGFTGRPAAAADADVCRRGLPGNIERRANSKTEAAEPDPPGNAIYDNAGGVRGAAGALQRAGRHSRGVADCEPAGGATGGEYWSFRQLPCDSDSGETANDL